MKSKVQFRYVLSDERPSLGVAMNIAWKSLKISLRYPFNILYWAFVPIGWIMPAIFQGIALTGGTTSTKFASTTGTPDWLSYMVLGSTLFMYVMSALWGMGNALRWEQMSGTLESLLVTPISRVDILIGAALAETATTTLTATVQLVVLLLIFGIPFALSHVLPFIVLLTLMLLALYGFAMTMAGVVMVFKDPDALTRFLDAMFYVLIPVRYPISELPYAARIISLLIPATYAFTAIRAIILLNKGIQAVMNIIVILCAFTLCLWTFGYLTFAYAEYRTKKAGGIGKY